MKTLVNPPFAPNLVESMRSIGYSFDTALADIIDNSIAANATKIDVMSDALDENSLVAVLDNGYGMNEEVLFNSMRYGCTNPNEERNQNDMGRFGLGMKSASLSQCRRLTVVSKSENKLVGMVWDLDYITATQDWNLQILEEQDILNVPQIKKLNNYNSGTLVVWEKLDRIKSTSSNTNEYLKTLLYRSIDHFALIFHRLIGSKLQIYVNGIVVEPRDPFLESNPATIKHREQPVKIDHNTIIVKPYILPHANKLSNADIKKLGGKESLRTEQGFYIYRNERLIIWGTWFRLENKNELSKLARVKVDIPNTLDYLWDIDIKKSRASLPEKIKINLINAVSSSCSESKNVYEYKGKKLTKDNNIHTWSVIEKRKEEGLGVQINLDNPLMKGFIDTLDDGQKKYFCQIVEDIESTLPLDFIYTQMAKGIKTEVEYTKAENELLFEEVKNRVSQAVEIGLEKEDIIEVLKKHEKYVNNEYVMSKIDSLK